MNHQASAISRIRRNPSSERRGGSSGCPSRAATKAINSDQCQRDRRKTDDVVPAEGERQAGGEQSGEHGARIAGARDAQRGSLMLGRIPERGERQRDGKGGARDAQNARPAQAPAERVDADAPRRRAGRRPRRSARRCLTVAALNRSTSRPLRTRSERAGEDGRRDHQAFLAAIRDADPWRSRCPAGPT